MESKKEKIKEQLEVIDSAHTQQISVVELQKLNVNPDANTRPLGETAYLPEPGNASNSRIPNLAEAPLPAPVIEPFSGAIRLAELTGSSSSRKKHFLGFFKFRKSSAEKLLESQEELRRQAIKAIKNTEKQIAKEKQRQAKLAAKKEKEANSPLIDASRYMFTLAGGVIFTGLITAIILLY